MSNIIFASDAMGLDSVDNGGYGIAATLVDRQILNECLELCFCRGYTVARLDGQGGMKYPNKIAPTVPISRWPPELTEHDRTSWTAIDYGRMGALQIILV